MQDANLRRNLPSPLPDHVEMEEPSCVRNPTRTDSYSSVITADDSSAPGPSTMWTDEKHSLYLDSLEASFVNQLNNSIALHGCLRKILWGPYSHQEMQINSSGSAHQDGKRKKVNPQRNQHLLESTADSCVRQFTSSAKRSIAACHDQEHDVSSSERLHAGENSPVCSTESSQQHSIEVSDQNFVDVDQGDRSNCRARAKRLKRAVADDSSSDQVVPCRNPATNYASTSHQISSIREEQATPENLENFLKPEVITYEIAKTLIQRRDA